MQYLKQTVAEELTAPYWYVTPDDWAPAGFSLGVWLADQRKAYNAEVLEAERVRQLDALGMVWNAHDHAFDEGLAVARAWAEEHGHLLAPVSEGGFPIGVWLKNQRAAARQAVEAAAAHEQGQRVPPARVGAIPEPSGRAGRHRPGLVPGLGHRLATLLPPRQEPPQRRRHPPPGRGRGSGRPGRRPRNLGTGAAARVGQTRSRAAVAARIGPRPRGGQRGRAAGTAHPGRQMAAQPGGRAPVPRPRRTPAGAAQAHRARPPRRGRPRRARR
ncbi:helicase associated domain-containing protein [Streptomyces sp. NPDC050400]|uniref:helicase associated domain-containing protein n=1 Tax=Streptomyces sp. NPDC050400 TaxID=3365610 RepID=UPI0037A8D130